MKTLRSLIGALRLAPAAPLPDLAISGVQTDSRKILPGQIFVAVHGVKEDGNAFIEDAIARGASAVVSEHDKVSPGAVPFIRVTDARLAVARLAAEFYDQPAADMTMVGITGTNGKTTCSYLLEHAFKRSGKKTGVVGTVNHRSAGRELAASQTTPGPLELHELLSRMKKDACEFVVMEVSSHALEQKRVSGIDFKAALFTNLTQDHLDYHKTFDAYFECKAKLFEELRPESTAVINVDDEWGKKIFSRTQARTLSYGIHSPADLKAEDLRLSADRTRFVLVAGGQKIPVELPLVGAHNVYNALGALGVLKGLGWDLGASAQALSDFPGVPGRLEAVRCGQNFQVFVDFAHTPDGLENVLQALAACRQRKLTVVFGCGGDRDRTKRPVMAAIAARHCDNIFLTSDNPRSEDPGRILDEIKAGFPRGFKNFVADVDRRKAIRRALLDAREGDIVLLAGKGHERTQVIGDRSLPFSDREEAERVLNGR